jgi:RNA polymerase sigma factor (sigma-70 family)
MKRSRSVLEKKMNDILAEQNSLMEKIMKDYGSLIKGAVYKAMCGQPCDDDIVSEVYFAVLLTLRKFGTGWNPPRSFIFTVVRNKVNDFLRQKYREKNGIEEIKKHLEEQASQKEEVVSRIHCLTYCEFRVFRLLGMGMNNSEIAQSLHVSLYTIRSHVKKIHAKCGVKDRAKLTLIAHQVCFRGELENPEGERASQKPPRPRRRGAYSQSEHFQPELWGPDLPALPIAVEPSTKYLS